MLEHAMKDLLNTDYNITDVALYHDFANVKSFTNLFKKIKVCKYKNGMFYQCKYL